MHVCRRENHCVCVCVCVCCTYLSAPCCACCSCYPRGPFGHVSHALWVCLCSREKKIESEVPTLSGRRAGLPCGGWPSMWVSDDCFSHIENSPHVQRQGDGNIISMHFYFWICVWELYCLRSTFTLLKGWVQKSKYTKSEPIGWLHAALNVALAANGANSLLPSAPTVDERSAAMLVGRASMTPTRTTWARTCQQHTEKLVS